MLPKSRIVDQDGDEYFGISRRNYRDRLKEFNLINGFNKFKQMPVSPVLTTYYHPPEGIRFLQAHL
jgi:transposase-like protein